MRGPADDRYRGPDRRTTPPGPAGARRWVRAAALACSGIGAATLTHALLNHGGADVRLTDDLWLLAFVLASLSGLGAHRLWLASGLRRTCRLATVACLIAGAAMVETLVESVTPPVLPDLLLAAAGIAALRAAVDSEVDTGASQPRECLTFAAGALVLWAPVQLGPGWSPASETAVAAGSGLLWAAAVIVLLATRPTSGRPKLGWVPLFAALVAGAELVHAWAQNDARLLAAVAAGLLLAGLLVASVGIMSALAEHALGRRDRLRDEQVSWQWQSHERQRHQRERVHEIDNALLAIEGAVSFLRTRRREVSLAQHRLADSLLRELQSVRSMVGQDSDADQEWIDLVSGECDLATVVAEHVTLARTRGCHVTFPTSTHAVTVAVDPDVVRSIVLNLLINVERHGGGSAEVSLEREGSVVRLRVRDRGPGIPREVRERIFEAGARGETSVGTGLGLHVARRQIRRWGGDLVVEDQGGRGASIAALFPAAVAAAPSTAAWTQRSRQFSAT